MADTKAPRSGTRASRRAIDNTAERALRSLETDGVAFATARGAAHARPVEELLDVYATRGLLEEQAARLAARHIGEHELAELERIAHAMQAPLLIRSVDEVTRLNHEFHRIIYRAARRPHLLLLIEQLWDATAEHDARLFGGRTTTATDVVFLTRSLLLACRARDASALGMLVRYESHQAAAAALEASSGERSVRAAIPVSRAKKTLRAVALDGAPAPRAARLA